MTRRQWGLGIASAAAVIAVITAFARIVGFGRWVVSASTVGRGCVGDVYAAANQIPNVLYEVVAGGALAVAVVPVISPMIKQGNPEDVRQTISAMLTWSLIVTVPPAALLLLVSGPLGNALAPAECAAQGPEVSGLASWLLRVFAVQIVLYAVGTVAAGSLQAHRQFLWPAVAPLLSSLVVIASYFAVGMTINGHYDDIRGLPDAARNWLGWGTTAGVLALTLPLLAPLRRIVPGLRLQVRFPDGVARPAAHQAMGGVAGLLAQQMFVVAVLALTRRDDAPVGSLNLFQYTQAIFLLPFAVLVIPLVTSAFPSLSAATDDVARFALLSARTLRTTLAVALLGTVALIGAAPALEMFFGDIESSGRGAGGMAGAVVLMALGLPGLAVVTQAARVLQAGRSVRPAAVGTAVAWLVAAAAATACVLILDVAPLPALTLGSTVGMTAGAVGLLRNLRRTYGPGAIHGVGRTVLFGGGAATVIGATGSRLCEASLGAESSAVSAVLVGSLVAGIALAVMAAVVFAIEPDLRLRFSSRRRKR